MHKEPCTVCRDVEVEPQLLIKIEVGIDDLCDILDIALDNLKQYWDASDKDLRLRAVIRDLDRQIDAGGAR